MGNNKIVKTAAAVALGASVLATSVAPGAASAATTYKVKSGKLVNAKTGKAVKGYKTFKKVLYKDGKKFTGLRSAKYYKAGKLATGTYKGKYYKTGVKFNGLKSGVYYKAGVKGTGVYKSVYYKAGKVATGVSGKKQYVKGALANKIVYKGNYYVKGVKATGVSAKKQYVKGALADKIVYNGNYYVKGVKGTGTLKGVYYVKGPKAQGLVGGTFYVDGKAGDGVEAGVKYVDGKLAQGSVDGVFYIDGKKDETAPVITVDKDAQTVEFGTETVTLPVATVTDNSGETVTATQVITYNGEVVEKVDTTKPGVYKITFTAKDANNNSVTKEATITVAAEKIAVESVSAINATTGELTVTLEKDASAADLKDVKLALKGAQDLTASFVKVEGKVATFKVDTDILGKVAYDGEYTVTSAALKGSATTTYSAVIAGTFVEGFAYTAATSTVAAAPLANATVTVDGKTTTTDTNGYYQLAVNAGAKTVEISKGNEYFVAEGTTNVARNESSVVNVDLMAVDATKLYFTGTVLDSKDSKAVEDANVRLQAKNDKGEWVDTAYTATTDAAGKFQFANNGATSVSSGTNKATTPADNVLAVGSEYRAVVEKAVSAANLDDVYKKQTVSFTVSNKKEETTKLVTAEKVAELQGLTIDASSLDTTTLASSVNVTFLNTNGEDVLENFAITTGTGNDVELSADSKSFKEAVEVVADKPKFANGTSTTTVKPRLVSGTYFMVVDNGTSAIKAYAVEVTEGGKATVKFAVEAAKTAQAKTSVDKVQYKESLAVDPSSATPTYGGTASTQDLTQLDASKSRTTDMIEASYAAYQTVAGKDIKITDSNAPKQVKAAFDANNNVTSITAEDAALERLAASVTYKVKSTSDFLVGNKDLTVKPDAATNNVTANVNAAAKLAEIKLTDKATGDALKTVSKTVNNVTGDYLTIKSLKLVNDEGKTVAEVSPNKEVAVTNTAAKTTAPTAKGFTTVSLESLGEETKALFTNIQADKYKLTVEVAGYKSGTSVTTDIIDFQNGEITADLEAIKETQVTGYIRYADNGETVADTTDSDAEASVIAYDSKGDAIKADNFGDDTNSTFSIAGLNAGEEYTFVVRGEGFETQAVKKVVSADDITSLNFNVVRGGNGQFKLQIVDSDNVNLDSGTISATNKAVKDAYYDTDDRTSHPTAAFDGSYKLEVPTATTGTDARTYNVNGVSAGAYTLKLEDTTTPSTKYVLPQTYNLTLKDINGTSYATSNGTEIIKVPLVGKSATGLNVALNLTFSGSAVETTANADIDYVQVIDQATGAIVATKRANIVNVSSSTTNIVNINVPNNATYTVKAFLNNGFVKTETVSVQNNDVKRTIDVSQTER